jgi:hypothetical protein
MAGREGCDLIAPLPVLRIGETGMVGVEFDTNPLRRIDDG